MSVLPILGDGEAKNCRGLGEEGTNGPELRVVLS